MRIPSIKIIQGGMGAGVSNWRLAQAVSRIGQLGVVSGTGLAEVLARRLQDGDPGEHIRRALAHFPFPRMAARILDTFYIPGGKDGNAPYRTVPMLDLEGNRAAQEMCIAGNFVEVFLAREGHPNPVGINYLEKIQIPHLPSIYGALLAGVAVVIIGAGIPLAVPDVLRVLSHHEPAEYPVFVADARGDGQTCNATFDPTVFAESVALPEILTIPDFFPVVSSDSLASILLRKANGPIDGFIIEGNLAGGHNALPRGRLNLSSEGEPIYGRRDDVNLAAFRDIGLPFWLAGAFGSAEGLRHALDEGANGIQVGTAFALCDESGLMPEVRRELIRMAIAGEARVITDPSASPTGFPFKVVQLMGTLSDNAVYQKRSRVCDLGFLRQPYRRENGKIGYRCPAEPVSAYVAKGGKEADALGRKCLCNALVANVGMAQRLSDGSADKCLITMGDDLAGITRFCRDDRMEFSAADIVQVLLGA